MSSAASTTPALDISKLPADLQAYIQQAIQAELAKNAPPPPKVLTPAEKCALYLVQAETIGLRGEKAISPGSLYVHDRILAILDILIDTVFPADAAVADTPVVSAESAV